MENKRIKIGFDCDEVLVDIMNPLVRFHNYRYGTSLCREQFESFNLWETWGGTEKQAKAKVKDFFSSEYFWKIKPLKYAQGVVDILSKDKDLVVVTSRPDYTHKKTIFQVDYFFPKKFLEIYFTDEWSQNSGRTKQDVCLDENIDILIEDSLENAISCSSKGINVLLIDCPWNKCEDLPGNVERINNGWVEVIKKVELIKNE